MSTTKAPPRTREGEEIWETTTAGRVWVQQVDKRGRERSISAGGKVGARLRITTEDREIAEERLSDPEQSPFRNGMLVRVDAGAKVAAEAEEAANPGAFSQALSTEELMTGFAKNGNAFHSYVARLNEVNTRRMLDLAPVVDASVAQVEHLQQVIREKYRPASEGPQPTYVEMQRRGEVAANV